MGGPETTPNAFVGRESKLFQRHMTTRLLRTHMPHLIPILDGLEVGAVVCDVGCGSGGITLDIANRYPRLTLLGVDMDEHAIEDARRAAHTIGVQNVRFAVGDATQLSRLTSSDGFAALDAGRSLVFSHILVMHVLDPPKVIIEMRAIAIPGGFVSLQESDAGMFTWYPENPGIASWSKAYPLLAGARGADPLAGRKLVSYALAAGFRRDDIVASLGDWIASTPQQREEFAGITIDMIRSLEQKGGILEKAGIDSETKEVIVDGLEQWARAKGAWLALPSPVVVCVKH